jgi:probable UDP-sugar transporter A4
MSDSILQSNNNNNENQPSTSLLFLKNNSLNSQVKSSKMSHSIIFRAMIFFQIIAYGSYSILVHLCEQKGMITFSSVTMNFLIEFFKLIFSLNAFIYFKQIHLNQIQLFSWFKQSIPYSIPAILYFLNNNLAVHIQIQMDPASYQILSNFKIFTTAILYRLIIKQKLTRQKWFALALLLLAGLTYSFGTLKNSSSISKSTSDSNTIIREMYIRPLGIPMIVIYCTLSGLAGVYNEWILKRNYNESIHLQNIFLYIYGTILNLIPTISLIITNLQTMNHFNLFHGFSLYTWIIVFTQVLNGLSMSVVIKHSSNIIRLFIISFSLIVTTILSLLIFHIDFNIYFFISLVIMICALSIFYTN